MTALYQIGDFIEFVEPASCPIRPVPKFHYMLRVRPNRELAVEAKLIDHDVDNYLPKEKISRRTGWNRYRIRTVAIFSGLILIPDFEADLMRLKKISNDIIGYVRQESAPVIVRPKMMDEIRKFEQLLDVPPGQRKRAFYVSQEVRIRGGSFDMWTAHIASLDNRHRITALVNLLGRMVPLDLSEDQVEAV